MPLQLTLSEAGLAGRQVFAIGDVHGCYESLVRLEDKLTRISEKAGLSPLFLFVGDLCDRGTKSRQVIEHLMHGTQAGSHITALGNHEFFYVQIVGCAMRTKLTARGFKWPPWIATVEESYEDSWMAKKGFVDALAYENYIRIHWAANGGATCLVSYGGSLLESDFAQYIPVEHLEFLLQCPIVIRTPFGVITHALATREDLDLISTYDTHPVPLGQLRESVSRCLWERTRPSAAPAQDLWHFSGHTPLVRVKRSVKRRWMQIDTGCVYGRCLTAVDMKSRKVWSVDTDPSDVGPV